MQARGRAGQKALGRMGSNGKDSFPCQDHLGPPGSSEPEGLQWSEEVPPSTAATPLSQAL